MDIDEIKEIITAATLARRKAHDAGDASAKAAAVREQLIAKPARGSAARCRPEFAIGSQARQGDGPALHLVGSPRRREV